MSSWSSELCIIWEIANSCLISNLFSLILVPKSADISENILCFRWTFCLSTHFLFLFLSFMNTFSQMFSFALFPILVMKKKALHVNNVLLLLSSILVFISGCQSSSILITSSDSESDSSLNQLSSQSSRTSSPSESYYGKYFYQMTNGGLPLDKEVTVFVLSGESKRLVNENPFNGYWLYFLTKYSLKHSVIL